MKKFFKKMQLEVKFRNAGEGHRLTDEPTHSRAAYPSRTTSPPTRERPISESQANAALAAMERFESKNKPPKKTVKLPEDKRSPQWYEKSSESFVSSKSHDAGKVFSVDGVKFVSALNGQVFDEESLFNHYKKELLLKLGSDEKADASCLMIHTLTADRKKVGDAVVTLNRYFDNVINNENDLKFRKIRKGNKVFSEKVAVVDGAEEFLMAVGFDQKLLPNNDGEEEIYFVLPNEASVDMLKEAKELLSTCKPLTFKLFRDAKAYRASDRITNFHLPDSFYKLSLDEVQREQMRKREDVELNQQLRTKAMRDKPKINRKYKYALLRIKFPNGKILQGTFGVYEKLSALKDFVRRCLNVDWVPFDLKSSLGKIFDQDEETLLDLSLVPYAVLNLTWSQDVKAQLDEQGVSVDLRHDLLRNIRELS